MRVRFQADADLDLRLVLGLLRREPAIDFHRAADAGLEGLSDPEVLARSAADDRVLVTHDRRTMPRHFASFIAEQESPGVIVVPQKLPLAVGIEDLLLIWALTEPAEWQNRIVALPL